MTKPSDVATDPTLAGPGTAADDDPGSAATMAPPITGSPRASEPTISGSGYAIGELLGRGGMGEVLLARDRRIGRDVAIKRMRSASPSPDALARFLREARIQARLEHPAVVPVHELGHDAEGRPFFTMKRLAGTTLAAVLAGSSVPLQQLVRTFIDVCFAIEFAHSRGVVHRDLKPANIMMGDFGEVYVLDWGVARVTDDDAPPDEPDVPSLDGETQAGSLLGTPGYMAPEQVRGEQVDHRADVYALGCILFEILAHEPLHPRADTLASTLSRPTDSPAKRAATLQIAPELDAACLAALSEHPAERPTARELATRLQRYLNGDRDHERRCELAAEEVTRCKAALAAGDRPTAMQAAGRALALDPESREAAQLVTTLLLEPPIELPAELAHHLVAVDEEHARKQWRLATYAFSAFLPFAPMIAWQGVISWPLFCSLLVLIVIHIVMSELNHRRLRPHVVPLSIGISIAVSLLFSRMIGPFMFVPGIVTVFATAWMSYPTIRRPWLPAIAMITTIIAPILLESIGVFSSTWSIEGATVLTTSAILEVDGPLTSFILVAATVGIVIVALIYARGLAVTKRDALRKVEIQAWHLRKLLPAER